MISDTRSRRTVAYCLVGGIVHAILALWLGAAVRGRSIPVSTPDTPSGGLVVAVTLVGLVLLGAVPLALRIRKRLVTPLVALGVLFAWAFVSSWFHFETARDTGATPTGLYADSLFGVLWFVPLAVVLLLGIVEYAVRTRFDSHRFSAVQN
ncbi:hypothetical protein GS429_06305 [Natronorubrum sp. JWXQ-INN-674]|uniref:Uncharacterized protein n=1 Tax=Natronorubrum halalkaliphilum TaxID=2691917 RepID=A0A6B0VIJ8_9EURY|nr:hypothetical protein [Natronorubrum halalkaliphilum]MXV61681.1 hypothetical protein [Natronorubrum halalkaliphilum]